MPDPDAFRNSFLLLQQQQRAAFTRLIEQTEATLAADWQRGPAIIAQYYAPLIDEYAKALADLRLAEENPAATLSLDWLTSRNAQLNTIEQSVRYSLDQYGHDAQAAVTAAQASSIDQGLSDAAQLTQRSLWPAVEGAGVPPAMLFNRP
ncbi:MAG TPA: hypothetical protein VFN11_06185, partial [Ktedonobacterales bacterium]|nr:hypothetical protein [Ktedonobacterales bacterium]